MPGYVRGRPCVSSRRRPRGSGRRRAVARQLAGQHRVAYLVADRRHARRAAQPLVELVAHQRPGELQLLLGPLVGQAVGAEVLAVGEHPLPDVVDAVAGQRRSR